MFSFGADPEVFVAEKRSHRGISAYGMSPGTKEDPEKTDFGAIQVDGMALEFNVNPVNYSSPAAFSTFNENIVRALDHMKKVVGKHKLAIQPVMDFEEAYMASQPAEAKELGCDPDYNAYTMEENPRPDGDRPFRTGAGHIHVGWGADIPVYNAEHHEICAGFVRVLDATVGIFMTMIDREPRRRELYGKAGAYRTKSYGVEYRTPSNVWIVSKIRRLVMFRALQFAVTSHVHERSNPDRLYSYFYDNSGKLVHDAFTKLTQEDIRKIIDTGDVRAARPIFEALLSRLSLTPAQRRQIREDVAKLDAAEAQSEVIF